MRLEPRSPHFGCQIRRSGAECSTGLDWVGNAFSLSARSSQEAAAICECAVGTIKSRVYRARTRLSKMLSIDSADMFGQGHTTLAVLSVAGRG